MGCVLMAQQKPLGITPLKKNFYVFTTYKTFNGKPMSANGMYVVTHDGIIMIDTPWDETQFQPLLDSIEKKHHKKVVLCVATHSHNDRSGGLEYYTSKGIKTYTTQQTDDISKESGDKRAEFTFKNDTIFTVGEYTFQTYYAGEGHTKDNIVIEFPKDKVLYGGCLIKSTEAKDLGYTGEANIQTWDTTLLKVKKKFKNPKYIITGHQDWRNTQSIQHTLNLIKTAKEGKKE